MAFNPDIPVDLGSNYTGRSQGTQSPLESLGTLFKGVAAAGEGYVKATDEAQSYDIEQTADKAIQNTLQDVPSDPMATQDIASAGGKLKNLEQARLEGKFSDRHIYSQMANISKDLRLKHPNRGQEIDMAVMSALGRSPANKVREELNRLAELEAAGLDASEKFNRQIIKENLDILGRLGIKPSDVDPSDPVAFSAVYNRIAQMKGEDAELAAGDAKLRSQLAKGEAAHDLAVTQGRNRLNQKFGEYFNGASSEFENFLRMQTDLQEKDTLGNPTGKYSPENEELLLAAFRKGKLDLEVGLQKTLTANGIDRGLRTGDAKALIAEQMEKWDYLGQSLFNPDYGIKGAAAREHKARMDGFENSVTKRVLTDPKFGSLRLGMAMTALKYAPEIQQYFLQKKYGSVDATISEEMDAAITSLSAATAAGVITDYPSEVQKMVDDGAPKSVLSEPIKRLGEALKDDKLTSDQAATIVKALTETTNKKDLLEMFVPGTSQEQIFTAVTNPKLAEKLKGTAAMSGYAMWVRKAGRTLMEKPLMDINSLNIPEEFVEAKFNPANGHMELIPHIPSHGETLQSSALHNQVATSITKAQDHLKIMNTYADRLYEASKVMGDDPAATLKAVYETLPLQPNWKLSKTMIEGVIGAEGNEKLAGSTGKDIISFSRDSPDIDPEEDDDSSWFGSRGGHSATLKDGKIVSGKVDVAKMDSTFASRLMQAVSAAEEATGERARLGEMYRDVGVQEKYYNAYKSGQGGLAARPGNSRHQIGQATDIPRGKILSWLHKHADDFGLEFLKGNAFAKDPVHIQLARGWVDPNQKTASKD